MFENYIMKPIAKKEMLNSLFFNEIDLTLRKLKQEFYTAGEVNEYGKENKDRSVIYNYNSLGFRSDEFTKDHDGLHVLFAGCSETEGVGGSLDSCWSYLTYRQLQKEQNISGFFNLARYGWGYDVIISNIMTYIKKYGKPDKIFVLFPNIGRFYKWQETVDDYEIFNYFGSVPNSVDSFKKDESWKRKITVEQQRSNFIIFTMMVKLFEDYCNSNSIDLVWGTWDREDELNYENVSVFANYIKMANETEFIKKNKDFFVKEIEVKKDWERKRDGHAGYLYHYLWSQCFLGRIDTKEYE